MSKIWEPQPLEVYKGWCILIETEASDNLNDWESSFLSNIVMRLDSGVNLTEAQAEKLEQLYVKHTK